MIIAPISTSFIPSQIHSFFTFLYPQILSPCIPKMAGLTAFVFYRYEPSMVAAVIFIIGFGISLLLHLKTLVQKRTWYFIPFILGCICK